MMIGLVSRASPCHYLLGVVSSNEVMQFTVKGRGVKYDVLFEVFCVQRRGVRSSPRIYTMVLPDLGRTFWVLLMDDHFCYI